MRLRSQLFLLMRQPKECHRLFRLHSVKISKQWQPAGYLVGKSDTNRSQINSGDADGACRHGGNNGRLYRVVGDGAWGSASGTPHNFKPKPGDAIRLPCPLSELTGSETGA
jgi:hypothetical protein